jgi:hypothetical protein
VPKPKANRKSRQTRRKSNSPQLVMPLGNDLPGMARRGGITLVIGAGVSVPRGVPSWNKLAWSMWKSTLGRRASSWPGSTLPNQEVSPSLPIIFELVYREVGETKFVDLLKKHLYSGVRFPDDDPAFRRSSESLAVIARLLCQEYKRTAGRRIDAVITLNADNLIEQAVSVVGHRKDFKGFSPIVTPISRGTHGAATGYAKRPIPVYHIHGYLPSDHGTPKNVRHLLRPNQMLVFTDVQYWSTSVSGVSFANRIMSSALSEGRCIFIGLSMSDINLLRWLALRTIERDREQTDMVDRAPKIVYTWMKQRFDRHIWIRPASDDPSGFLSQFLKQRGIITHEIADWSGKDFQSLMQDCFPGK